MHGSEPFDSFDFDNDLVFHNQTGSMAAVKLPVFADHGQRFLLPKLVSPCRRSCPGHAS
jgi:hypothetical protein